SGTLTSAHSVVPWIDGGWLKHWATHWLSIRMKLVVVKWDASIGWQGRQGAPCVGRDATDERPQGARLLGRPAVEMFFHALGVGLRRVHDAVTMLGRPVDRVDAERLSAGIDEVVTRAGRDDDGVIGPDRRRLAVDADLAGPPLDAEELIAVVMHFLADLLAGVERHQDELEVLAGVEHAAKVGVPLSQLLDVVGEALHGCPPGILDCRAGILPVCPHCAGGLPVFCPVPSLFGNSWLCGLRSDVQLETFVRGYESQALVESN